VPINNNKQNKDKDLKVRVDTSGQIAIDANRKLDGGLEADVKNNEGQASVKIGS
jgi:hypothetical protein